MPRESDRWYDLYLEERELRLTQHARKLARLGVPAAIPPEGPTLDVACGFGETLELLHAAGRRRLVGLDVHDRSLPRAAGRYSYLVASAASLPFPDESFAALLCLHALHHLAGPEEVEAFLAEARRVLRPGGVCVLVDHYDSPQLRLAVWLIASGLAAWTPRLASLREQLHEERAAMRGLFTSWPRVQRAIRGCGLARLRFHRDLFFFYYLGRKLSGRRP